MKKLLLIPLALLICSSFLYAQDDMSALKEKLQKMNNEYAQHMVSGDMESMWQYYTDNVISLPSYEPMLKGIEACKESSEKMTESGMKFNSFKTTVTDVMKSGDFVIDIGTYEVSMSIPGMDMPMDDHGKYLTIWEVQDDGSMKVKAETWNTDVNPWAQMQMMNGKGEGMGMSNEKEE